jgi:hypothetical protein
MVLRESTAPSTGARPRGSTSPPIIKLLKFVKSSNDVAILDPAMSIRRHLLTRLLKRI